MQERFLHFVWQFQYFNKQGLKTINGEALNILHPGTLNSDAGPDFTNAKIKIGEMAWHGQAEIHLKSSDWNAHKHTTDSAYNNVVLHVVWDDDQSVVRKDGSKMPTLELKHRVDPDLILRSQSLLNNPQKIPCAGSIHQVKEITLLSMLDKAMAQRLEIKSQEIVKQLSKNNNDWETTAYQLLATNFGFKLNKESFLTLSKALPLKIIAKHADQLHQVEALLFGQAGFLDEALDDPYFQLLKREYNFLAHKYGLSDKKMEQHQWKFLRLRPANFPTIRIAQFAALLHQHRNLFSLFLSVKDSKALFGQLGAKPSEFWKKHYNFKTESNKSFSIMGKSSMENIIINTVAPLLASYGKSNDQQQYVDRAIHLLQGIASEKNRITRQWEQLGIATGSAFDSQALIELYNNYCLRHKCLSCNIGVSIVKDKSS